MRAAVQGLSLIELMIAIAILAVALTGVGMTLMQLDRANIFQHDRALAHKACQQVMEIITNEDLTDAVSRNNTRFDVYGMTDCDGTNLGLITVQDLGWDGAAASSYLFTIDVTDARTDITYARVVTVRTN